MKMSNNLPSSTRELSNKHILLCSFVCLYIPFIYNKISSYVPFVCKKIPTDLFKTRAIRIQGFTLIELVVTMAVAAILVVVAVPSMRTVIQNGRLNTQANDLIGDLSLARSEAIKRRTFVGVCISTNGTTCAVGGNWRDGRAVFVGTDVQGAWLAGDTILRFRGPLVSATDTLTTAIAGPIIFSANGASNLAVGVAGVFTFCDDRGFTKGKWVNVNSMGQTAVSAKVPLAC